MAGAEPMTRGGAASSQPLGYYPMPPDILENDRKLSVVLAGPQPPIVDKDFARKWPRRLCSAGAHYGPVGHPVTADFRHLLFGHSPFAKRQRLSHSTGARTDYLRRPPTQCRAPQAPLSLVSSELPHTHGITCEGSGCSQADKLMPRLAGPFLADRRSRYRDLVQAGDRYGYNSLGANWRACNRFRCPNCQAAVSWQVHGPTWRPFPRTGRKMAKASR